MFVGLVVDGGWVGMGSYGSWGDVRGGGGAVWADVYLLLFFLTEVVCFSFLGLS